MYCLTFTTDSLYRSYLVRAVSINPENSQETFVSATIVKAEQKAATMDRDQPGLDILVAEDNLVNQRLISAILLHSGHRVVVVEDGEQAVKAVREQNFDIVLMDIHMPNVDGLMATKQIREMSGPLANLPIVAVTANALNADRDSYVANGLTGFVAKPIDPQNLMAEIATALVPNLSTDSGIHELVENIRGIGLVDIAPFARNRAE